MKTTLKRIISVTLAWALVLAMAFPAFAAGTITPNTGTQVVYRTSKTGTSNVGISLASGSKSFTIKRADVKVTPGATKAKLIGFSKWASTDEDSYCDSTSGKWSTSKYNSLSYSATLSISKPGTATVSYKIGSKTYKTKAKVLAYTNPAKSVVMTGVNSGKNMASYLASSNNASKTPVLKKKTTGSKLTVKPASGWTISNLSFEDSNTGIEREIYSWKDEGLSTATIDWGTLLPTHNYSINIRFVNKKNKASIYCSYYIKGAKASD